MKRLLPLFLALSSLYSEEPKQEESPAEKTYSLWDFHPIHVGGNAIYVGSAKASDTGYGGNIGYQKENAFLYMLLPISAKSYFFPRVEWDTFVFDWDKNPKFSQDRYYFAQFALTFYTTAIDQWRWILRANMNLDIEHFNRPSKYALYELLAWGRYEIHRKWHYHIGTFGYTGMEGSQVYPIIGVDFSPNNKWTLLLVFPIDYYVQYKVGDNWKFSLKGRPLKERFRTGKNEAQPSSIFSYSSMGAELNAHYERFMRFEAELYVGYNFGGSFYIKDKNNHNSLYGEVGSAPYVGGSLDYAF